MKRLLWLGLFILLFALAGCARVEQETSVVNNPKEVYRPPTVAPETTPVVVVLPSITPSSTPVQREIRPTATLACEDDLRFLEDLTIPDGARVAPEEFIDKRWLVENAGTCNWDRRYRLRLIEGVDLQDSEEQALYPARSGTQAVIRVLFRAPDGPGSYRSAWQAFDPQGQAFGDLIYVEIVVRP